MVDFMEISLLFITLFITTTPVIDQMIAYYRWQSGLVAVITGLAVISTREVPWFFIIPIAILPGSLALFIQPVLVRITVSASLADLFHPEKRHSLQTDAKQVWLSYQKQSTRQPGWQHIAITLVLVSLAFLIAFKISADNLDQPSIQIGLAVSLALHLIGLYTMITRQDIISQVVGLLVMDHGLYLAVVKIVEIPMPAGIFVVGLYFYTLITLFILFFLLPIVRQMTTSIDLSAITDSSKLKG